ncbi:MAG: TolC family protein, partial [Myxococcota bacterium]
TLGFNAHLNWSNAPGFADQNVTWNLGLTLNIPIYEGGRRFTALRDAQNLKHQAKLQREKLKLQIKQEVRKASIALKNTRLAVAITQQQRKVAEKNYQQQMQRYKVGMATPLALSESNTQLQNSATHALREQLNYDLSIIALQRATGKIQH